MPFQLVAKSYDSFRTFNNDLPICITESIIHAVSTDRTFSFGYFWRLRSIIDFLANRYKEPPAPSILVFAFSGLLAGD